MKTLMTLMILSLSLIGCEDKLEPTTYKLTCGQYASADGQSMLCRGHLIECQLDYYTDELSCVKMEEE